MDITVSAQHMDISPALRAAAEEKIGRLSRFLDGIARAEVHFVEEKNPRISAREVCEVTLFRKGEQLRCKVAAADPFAAVDRAVSKLEHQLHKRKTKRELRNQQGPRGATVAAVAPAVGADLDDGLLDALAGGS